MDLKSLFQGRPLFQLKTFASFKFARNKTERKYAPEERATISRRKVTLNSIPQNGSIPSINKTDKNQRHKHKNKQKVNNDCETQNTEERCKRNENVRQTTYNGPDTDTATKTGSATTEAARNMADLFPRNTHWFVFLFTLVFRVWYVCRKKNWWILHPDEIYQTLEVAHSEVYGYGFRTYEYLPEKISGYHVSAARAQEIELGMFSLRSFMLPHLISVFMFLVDKIGPSAAPYLVARVTHTVITSFLPLSVYFLTRSVFRSRDTASLAAMLVSTSQTLNMLGTHSLVNSFLSPFVFLCLTPLVKSLLTCIEQQPETTKQENQTLSRDHNSNLTVINKIHSLKGTGVLETKLNTVNEEMIKLRKDGHVKVDTKHCFRFQFDNTAYFSGFVLSLCVYSRCDIILLPIIIALACSKCSFRKLLCFVLYQHAFLSGFLSGILIGGFYDRVCYGVWFISPCQWVKFNVFHATSHVLFGKQPVTFYVENVLFSESLNTLLCIITFLDLFVIQLLPRESANEKSQRKQADHVPFCVFLLLLLTYSLSSHKEIRFFHNGIVFMYIHLSNAILRLFKTVVNYANQKHGQYYCWFYLFIGCLASSQLFSFIQIQGEAISRWSYMGNNISHEVNECLHYVSHQNDVTGVFLDQPIYMTGGYTILHKDVPIYALNMYEFFEFSHNSRLRSTHAFNQNISLSSFAYISDFVSVHNLPYLLKQLLSKSEYNYLVLGADRQFVETGYNEVFRIGSTTVMKRQMTNESEAFLINMASYTPLGHNATILEYEGYWLLRYGLYKLAQEKLLFANHMDNSRIGPYQLLVRLFHYFKQEDLVRNVLDACIVLHDRSKCMSEYDVVKLHEAYFKDVDILYNM